MKKHVFFLFTLLVIGQSAFAYSFSAVAPSGQTLYYNIENGVAKVTSQNNSSPYYTTYPTGALTIPSSVNYNGYTYPVTEISNGAFYECTGLTSVSIPSSVTSIGVSAFYGCVGLTSITIPNSVTSIGNYVFGACIGLPSIVIPNSVTSIGAGAFSDCISLVSITIPGSVTSIGEMAFAFCDSLSTAIFTGTIAQWCNINFSDGASNPMCCSGSLYINGNLVTNLVIPNGVTEIKQYTFAGCTCMTSVTIPNSVTSIGRSAFSSCTGLTSVTIPTSVISIGSYAFYGCNPLLEVYLKSTTPPTLIDYNAFTYAQGNIYYSSTNAYYIIVPRAALDQYRAMDNWFTLRYCLYVDSCLVTLVNANPTLGSVRIRDVEGMSFLCPYKKYQWFDSYNVAEHYHAQWSWSDYNVDSASIAFNMKMRVASWTLTANFVLDSNASHGIADVDVAGINVYASEGCIMVRGTKEGMDVRVYDMMGRRVAYSTTAMEHDIHMPTAGVYLVKVGTLPARKVVVIR